MVAPYNSTDVYFEVRKYAADAARFYSSMNRIAQYYSQSTQTIRAEFELIATYINLLEPASSDANRPSDAHKAQLQTEHKRAITHHYAIIMGEVEKLRRLLKSEREVHDIISKNYPNILRRVIEIKAHATSNTINTLTNACIEAARLYEQSEEARKKRMESLETFTGAPTAINFSAFLEALQTEQELSEEFAQLYTKYKDHIVDYQNPLWKKAAILTAGGVATVSALAAMTFFSEAHYKDVHGFPLVSEEASQEFMLMSLACALITAGLVWSITKLLNTPTKGALKKQLQRISEVSRTYGLDL